MPNSTSTLLDVVNHVLLSLNERPLTVTTSPIGQQVKASVKNALNRLTQEFEWNWLKGRIQATSWTGDVADLPDNVQEVRGVAWDNGSRLIELPYASEHQFDAWDNTAQAGTAFRPIIWAYQSGDYTKVRLAPYPSDSTAQDTIFFYVTYTAGMPSADDTTFSMPELFIPALEMLAAANFALYNREDQTVYALFERQYSDIVARLALRHTGVPGGAFNMYKRRGGYGGDIY